MRTPKSIVVSTFASCIFLLLMSARSFAQELSGEDVLNRSIAYHDADGNWKNFKGKLVIQMTTPKSSTRNTVVSIDLPAQYFKTVVTKESNTITSILEKENCSLELNGNKNIAQKDKDSLRISCERAKMMKDYYTYLYGLPMKLKDPGTIIAPKTQKKSFKGKEYLVLKVNYTEAVGEDTWYFYFDPKTYAMEVYQFYHDESKNDGEYILLNDIMEFNNIKIPKTRAWYYNKDNTYLGTDALLEVNSL